MSRDPSASSDDTIKPATQLPNSMDITKVNSSGDSTIMSKTTPKHSPLWSQTVSSRLKHKFIDEFTPVYFASVMGTGMSANLLYNFPFPARWLEICGIIMALVSLIFFAVLLFFFTLSLYCRPKFFSQIHRDPALAPSMGCFVMGYTTLISFLQGVLGTRGITGIWVLWWIVVFGSFYTGIVTFFFSLMTKYRKSPNVTPHASLSMQYLLPVVTLTVAAALGGLITSNLPHRDWQIITMVVSFIMWAIAVLLASIITTINFWRIFIHKVPNTAQVLTMFLPIGFVGQGAFAILLFGYNCLVVLIKEKEQMNRSQYISHLTTFGIDVSNSNIATILALAIIVVCAFVALMLMSFGFLLTIFSYMAVLSKIKPFCKKPNRDFLYQTSSKSPIKRLFVGLLRFQKGFWSMTFPLGTMSLATHEFSKLNKNLRAFQVVSTIYALLVIITTLGCIVGVLYRAIAIFAAGFTVEEEKVADKV